MNNKIFIKFDNILFKVSRKIRSNIIKNSSNNRPVSHPYISGDTLRSIADQVYDETNKIIDTNNINDGDIIFINANLIGEFFRDVHPKIISKYKLITHNADININDNFHKYIDDKIIMWFAQNVITKHPKITPIPIGLENLHYYNNGITKYFDKYKKIRKKKNEQLLYGFSVHTNPKERGAALNVLRQLTKSHEIKDKINSKIYLNTLLRYSFVASPPGNGEDCHRTWEALYLGVIPIVKRSALTEFFLELGLPLWIVDDWEELSDDKINVQSFNRIMNYSKDYQNKLQVDFWINFIKGNKGEKIYDWY